VGSILTLVRGFQFSAANRKETEMAGDFCWIEMVTEDRPVAQRFYGDLFGWSYEEVSMGGGGIYAMFQPGAGGPGGGIMAKPMPGLPTTWMPYVAVDDLEAAVQRVRDLGGAVQVEPKPVPGHGRFAVVADPTGGVIGLWRNED
jgi:hypothetical protein